MVTISHIWQLLAEVFDPEVPVLTVLDLGIVRDVRQENTHFIITITPTYTGCPAMDTIAADIRMKLQESNVTNFSIKTVLAPAWTTDWLSENGKKKLQEYGIAPPVEPIANVNALFGKEPIVPCPICQSKNTQMVSLFGSTACKAHYKCKDCLEPFDYFKCLR